VLLWGEGVEHVLVLGNICRGRQLKLICLARQFLLLLKYILSLSQNAYF